MLIRGAEVNGRILDVRCAAVSQRPFAGQIVAMAPSLSPFANDQVVDASGGCLLPGLHDHHIHLRALAAQADSVDCSPAQVSSAGALSKVLQQVRGEGWIRGLGYHESTAGELDARGLDQLIAHRPVRLQHRSGKLWMLNSMAIAQLHLIDSLPKQGLETDEQGRLTGRLFRLDAWLGERLREVAGQTPLASKYNDELDNLQRLSQRLLSYGITGCTDTSVTNNSATREFFASAQGNGIVQQRLLLMGDLSLNQPSIDRLASDIQVLDFGAVEIGALKVMLDEDNLPDLNELIADIKQSYQHKRAVAFHCVSRVELLFALAALQQAGSSPTDRIEHASVVDNDIIPLLRSSGACVVTQPAFISQRGDQYRVDLEPQQLAVLYRYQSLLDQQIPVACSSDAPYGTANPWQVMQAAVQRRTDSNEIIGLQDRVTAQEALRSYLSHPRTPGGVARELRVGVVADLCLLKQSWSVAQRSLGDVEILATIVGGRLVYTDGQHESMRAL